ncbi:hypothetical protein ACFFJN_04520, partial [Erwinia mallotivora]|uniref:hypothetical protein n=1 Tax=Erwinia mallotivora TaxID=69222 RepID=UPI0035E46FE3
SLSPVGDRVGLAIDQIAQSGLSSLKVIYYSEQLFIYDFYVKPKGTFLSDSTRDLSGRDVSGG